jgi:sigma-70-like protein
LCEESEMPTERRWLSCISVSVGSATSLARRVCVDGGWAQDVVQEVFLTLWRDPESVRPLAGGVRDVAAHADPSQGG